MKDLFLISQSHVGMPVASQFNDLEIADYDLVTVEGPARKIQDVIKILLTRQGMNLVYPSYGSLVSQTGGKRVPTEFNEILADSVREAMAWLQGQEESNRPDERIENVVTLSVSDGGSPSEKQVNLVVRLEDGQILRTSFPVNL